jgi:hypothetical protein
MHSLKKLASLLLLLCFTSCANKPEPKSESMPTSSSSQSSPAVAQVPRRSLQWNDRRPIGTIFLGNSPAYTPNNPRMWLNSQNLNLFTAEGKREFRSRMLNLAKQSIRYMKEMDAQGVIVFDIEGIEAPHPHYTWVGDPRLLRERAPEMDEIADEFFQQFRDAGLRVGVTIRSQFMFPYETPLPPQWWRTDKYRAHYWGYKTPKDAIEGVSAKISYARKRWGATLFYLDSNNEEWFEVVSQLHQRFPDVLIIPEHTKVNPAYLGVSSPLERLDSWKFTEPKNYRKDYPAGFRSILLLDPKNFERKHQLNLYDYLLPKVQSGDILMINTWYPDPYQEVVKRLNRTVYGDRCCTWNANNRRS